MVAPTATGLRALGVVSRALRSAAVSRATDHPALHADWLGACRRAAQGVGEVLAGYATTRERQVGTGRGAGGDESLVFDRAAEGVIFAELEALHSAGAEFTAISEERGEVPHGDGSSPVRVVVDPIDGSLNAKRLLPTHCVSIAVSGGETMEDVEFAFVHDFGTGEEFVARRHQGAQLNGAALAPNPPPDGAGLEIVGFEAARPDWLWPVVARLEGSVHRVRVIGTIALSLCYVAAARFDGMVTANTCRSVDAAAAQLIAREAGAYVSVLGYGGVEAPLDLDARYRLVAARDPEGLDTLARAVTDT
jgi:myo-inositol-1(or 4)-monophosphatase